MQKVNDKKIKNNSNGELNALFEKLLARRNKGSKSVESLKRSIIVKLDREISYFYNKKDLIAEMWSKQKELRLQKISVLRNISRNSLMMNLRYLISMPFIYSMVFPAIMIHITLEIYHQICFRLWAIPRINPREYFIFDRQLLPYLNWLEKINCFYCSYFNCLVSYLREISACTEKYWCPIKHSKMLKDQHNHYDEFVDYSDGEALREKWDKLRKY